MDLPITSGSYHDNNNIIIIVSNTNHNYDNNYVGGSYDVHAADVSTPGRMAYCMEPHRVIVPELCSLLQFSHYETNQLMSPPLYR